MQWTPGQVCFISEHGHGTRPAKVRDTYTHSLPTMGERVVIDFTDDRAGSRDCFLASVFATAAEAEANK